MIVARTLASSGLTSNNRSSLLGGNDLEERDDFVGVRELVGDQREVGELGEFLSANSGVPQRLNDRPGQARHSGGRRCSGG